MAKNGPLTKVTYGNGYTVEYGYDALGRVTVEKRNGVKKYRYYYSAEGSLSRKEELNSSGTVIRADCYEYDSLGRLIRSWEETLSGNYLKRGLITQHIYDTSNRLTEQSWRFADGTAKTEQYVYNNADGTLSSFVTASERTVNLTYDTLKRLASKTDGNFTVSYGYQTNDNGRTSTRVDTYTVTDRNGSDLTYAYAYDKSGNITQIKENGTVVAQYVYDAQSQLKRETLTQSGVVYDYTYDTAGNIRSVKTTQNGSSTTKTYTYGDSSWKNLLTKVDGHALTYDNIGNPLTYYNGQSWTFTWQDGRRLATAQSGNTSVSYEYDSEGIRTSKTVGNTTYHYTYLGGKLVRQTWGSHVIDFAYDEQGRPYSLTYDGATYFYVLNLQGDVVKIARYNGDVRASYTYDAWGNILSSSGTLADINPLRYRGYVYDDETQLYYLDSRYYDAENRRFINADSFASTGQGILGYNMFAYCLNNPATGIDSQGFQTKDATREYAVSVGGGELLLLLLISQVKSEFERLLDSSTTDRTVTHESHGKSKLGNSKRRRAQTGANADAGAETTSPDPWNNRDDDSRRRNWQRVNERYLEQQLNSQGTNPHEVKYDYLGRNANIKRYDIYVDKLTGQLAIFEKSTGRLVDITIYFIGE